MKFCNNCGNKIKKDQLFCTCCGDTLIKEATNKTESSYDTNLATITPDESRTSNLKLSRKLKITMVLFTVLIIAIFATIKVANSLSDPNKLVTRFEKDVASNNTSDLTKILYYNDPKLKVDSKNISPLISYFKSNPSYFNKVIQNLKNDAFNPKDINSLSIRSSNTLTLANKGKTFFIFPNYKIIIKPSFVNIATTVKDVTFSINNTQIGKSDTDKSTKKFGPYIPGNYSILANYKGKYITLSKPYAVSLVTVGNGISELSVFNDIHYLNISSDYPNAEIFVNGKKTNVKVKDATKFGPIDSSSKIYAEYLTGDKTLKSKSYSVSSSDTSLYLSFENSNNDPNDVKNQLKNLLSHYTSYSTQAIKTNNISLIDPYVASGSDLYKEQQSYIPSTHKAGIQVNIVSANITSYNISDNSKSGSITTSLVYNIISKNGASSNKTFNYVYNFKYNDSTSSYQFVSYK